MVLNFDDFLLENKIENLLESGLVSGKFDFSDLTKACNIWIDVYRKMGVSLDAEKTRMFYVIIKDKGVWVNFSPYGSEYNIAEYSPSVFPSMNELDLHPKFLELDPFSREITIAHEFSHSMDPSIDALHYYREFQPGKFNYRSPEINDKRFHKYLNYPRDREELVKNIQDLSDKLASGDPLPWYRIYMRQTTEVEAHVGMLIYGLNAILLKDQSKLNDLKNLLSRGGWDIDSIFPELKPVMDRIRPRIGKFDKVINKLKRRLGALVSTIKAGEKIDFSLYSSKNEMTSEFYEKVKEELIKEKVFGDSPIEKSNKDSRELGSKILVIKSED